MATAKLNSTYTADITKVNQVSTANIASINGITWADTSDSPYNDIMSYSAMFSNASTTRLRIASQTAGDTKQYTVSVWIKLGANTGGRRAIGSASRDASNNGMFGLTAAGAFEVIIEDSGTTKTALTTALFRDHSGWYHFVLTMDMDEAAAADRYRLWCNGVQQTWDGASTFQAQGNQAECFQPGNNDSIAIGWNENASNRHFDGYMARFECADGFTTGSGWEASDFGETVDGIWVPKTFAGSYGNGFLLDFSDNTHFGDDTSGNGNDFTDSNFGTDHQVLDRPEDNYCILDSNAMRSDMTALKEGGLRPQDAGAAWHSILGTQLLKSGKWYFEVDIGSDVDDIKAGITAAGELSGDIISADTDPGASSLAYVMHADGSGTVYNAENGGAATGDDNLDAPTADDVMTIAIDCDAGKIWFGMKNVGSGHVWGDFGATGVGDPANGNNPAFSSIDFDLYDYVPVIGVNAHSTSTINFGQRTFSGTQPSGFNALCTENITEPTVRDPQDEYVNVVTYTGDGTASNGITGVGFQPDLVWIKNIDQADTHMIFDSTRGAGTYLTPVGTTIEQADADTLLSFDADGFSVGADVKANTNTEEYVALCLQKQSAFFDIVQFSGTGAAHAENHSLDSAPTMMLLKNEATANYFKVYHKQRGAITDPETDYCDLSFTTAVTDNATYWNDVAPTSSQFTVGTASGVNNSGDDITAYLFTDLDGIFKTFSYTGNGNVSGPYIYCGFRPIVVMLFYVSGGNYWMWFDHARESYNEMTSDLTPALANADPVYGTEDISFYANGFKITDAGTSRSNTNNGEYIGFAISDQPFKYANAR